MRKLVFGVVAAMGMSLIGAPEATAQDSGWWGWALPEAGEQRYDDRYDRDRDDRWDRDDDRYDRRRDRDDRYDRRRDRDDRYRYDRRSGDYVDVILGGRGDHRARHRDRRDRRRGNGPAFCRSGRGHPVHGRGWCRDRGWGWYDRGPVVWYRRGGWDDVRYRTPRVRYRHGAILDERDLIYILGEVIFRRLAREAHLAHTDHVRGRWLRPGGRASVLQIRSGAYPMAELSDTNGDGRVDVVLLPRR